MLLNDHQIRWRCKYENMIAPFETEKISKSGNTKILSRGLSSFGYDLTLAPHLKKRKFSGHNNIQDALEYTKTKFIIDPKREKEESFMDIAPVLDEETEERYFILEPGGFYLGVTTEVITMPNNIFAVVTNKSSYARCGVDFAITTIEPSWTGALTLEIKNENSNHAVRLYVGEGCVQALFFEGKTPQHDYGNGKYQNQGSLPQIAR